jgi:hypothetical protein
VRPQRLIGLSLLALASACADDLTTSDLLVRSRALVAKITVVGDETRSNPAPGETAEVVIHFGDPGAKVARTWALVVCEPQQTTFGPAICTSFNPADFVAVDFETTLSTTEPFDPPAITVPVWSDAELRPETTELLMIGAVCSGGIVNLEGEDNIIQYFEDLAVGATDGAPPVCVDGIGEGELVTLRIPLMRDGQANTHPVMASLRRNGAAFIDPAPDDAPTTGCVSLEPPLPTFPASTPDIALTVVVTSDSRETYDEVDVVSGEVLPVTESIQIEYVATAGDLDRTFGFIDPGEESNEDHVGWELPAAVDVPPDGLLVRFYFSLRDGRGGTDFAERAICIVPDL